MALTHRMRWCCRLQLEFLLLVLTACCATAAAPRRVLIVFREGSDVPVNVMLAQAVRANIGEPDQIRVGDTVIATVVEKLVAALAQGGKTSADGTVAVAAMAPKGTQPGGVVDGVMQESAEIIAIDPTKRSATLRFEDGLTKTFPIRDDVDLSHGKVGDQVVFRFTEMIAIKVERPQ